MAVHPDDEKDYNILIGKTALVPMLNREIPVIGDEYVDPALARGARRGDPRPRSQRL